MQEENYLGNTKMLKYQQNKMNSWQRRDLELNWKQVDVETKLTLLEEKIGELTLVAENLLFNVEDANYRRKLLDYVLNR